MEKAIVFNGFRDESEFLGRKVFFFSGPRLLLLILAVTFFFSSNLFAQKKYKNVDKQTFDQALATLKRETSVPIKIPDFIPGQEETLVYSVLHTAARDRYEIHFEFTPDCGGTPCHISSVSGEKISKTTEPPIGKKIRLKKGKIAFYDQSTCGASCGDDSVTWDEAGYRYIVGARTEKDALKMANSAAGSIEPNLLGKTFSTLAEFRSFYLEKGDGVPFEATGDLNGDRLADWAGLIQREKKIASADANYNYQTNQLYILLRHPNGGYRIAEKTPEKKVEGLGQTYLEDLSIRNSSLYLQRISKGADYIHPDFYQFKLYRDEWRLIGYRDFQLAIAEDYSVEVDRNLLTGNVIIKRQKGETKPRIERHRKQFGKLLLKDFDFDYLSGFDNPFFRDMEKIRQ